MCTRSTAIVTYVSKYSITFHRNRAKRSTNQNSGYDHFFPPPLGLTFDLKIPSKHTWLSRGLMSFDLVARTPFVLKNTPPTCTPRTVTGRFCSETGRNLMVTSHDPRLTVSCVYTDVLPAHMDTIGSWADHLGCGNQSNSRSFMVCGLGEYLLYFFFEHARVELPVFFVTGPAPDEAGLEVQRWQLLLRVDPRQRRTQVH